ncbi:MAG: hypothetical protein NTY90_02745 [Candidatus Micrarchaeota archaeon]|nr:hypothetical protein [Candidatus Micrarchaeota archaeon]
MPCQKNKSMQALVVFEKRVAAAAGAVAKGLAEGGVHSDSVEIASFSEQNAAEYQLVLIGAEPGLGGIGPMAKKLTKGKQWHGRSVALFFSVNQFSKKALAGAAAALAARGAAVNGTIALRRAGFLGLGRIMEDELYRAQAFGERMGLAIRGVRARKPQEKARIRFYKKQDFGRRRDSGGGKVF